MPPERTQQQKLLEFGLILVLAYLLSQFLFSLLSPPKPLEDGTGEVLLSPLDATIRGGHHPVLRLRNETTGEVAFLDRCPQPPVDVFRQFVPLTAVDAVLPCIPLPPVPAGGEIQIDLAPWKYALFSEYGEYEVHLPIEEIKGIREGRELEEEKEVKKVMTRFEIYEPGVLVKLFRTLVTKPFLNFLIFIASILPGHSLGVGIIVLTILVKFLLYFPTQRALEGQRGMQKLQPALEALKKQHGGDPKRLQEETVRLWKEHGVNPFSTCLPMVLQFPVLIGLFFVVRDGVVLELSQHLLYPVYADLPWTFGTAFLGLDLTKPNILVMPLLLALLQFVQMKLSMVQQLKGGTEKGEKQSSQQEVQQKVMLYALPVMVGFFAVQFPTAVSLYWGVSTLFAIGQQVIVNRKK